MTTTGAATPGGSGAALSVSATADLVDASGTWKKRLVHGIREKSGRTAQLYQRGTAP